jgi:MFS transporter, Spinster family, sphingosine-1-phosphate transporter
MSGVGVPRAQVAPATARNVLIVLTFVNLFNYIDRFIVPGLAVSLGKSELHLDRAHIGLLATGFILVYAIASPWFGELGDLRHRPRLIALGVAIWSVATVLGGFSVSFVTLFLARATLGIGEAAYGSIAPSLLADSFPRRLRGRVFSVFYAAIPIGSALGYVIAGGMAEHFGWRSAFFVAGAPGLLLAALLLKLPEVPRGAQDADDEEGPHPTGRTGTSRFAAYSGLLRNTQYRTTVLGYAAYTFALGALAFWFPDFLVSFHGMQQAKADYLVGLIAVGTGFIGTFAGGWIGDYVLRYTRHAYLLVSGIATLIAAPFCVLALTAHDPKYFLTGLVVAELMMFASTGPINSAIVNYVAPTQRATAMAFSILLMHLLGDAPSPFLVGAISTASAARGTPEGAALQHAMLILPVAILLSGVVWTAGGLRREARGA